MSAPQHKEIKVPPAQIWREFRMRFMPLAVFAAALVAAVRLWNVTVVGPTMVGEVEAVQTMVVSPDAGVLTNLLVRRFQMVKAGDPVAELISTDVRSASSRVQDMRSRIALQQLEINSVMDRDRIAFDYQALAMNTLRFRSELAAAKAELPTLEGAAARLERGWKENVIALNEYELAVRQRDATRARVAELEKLVVDAEGRLAQAASTAGAFTNFSADTTLPQAVERLIAERRNSEQTQKTPIVLRAPIDGTVSMINRRAGENVLAGDIILTIHALEGDRIVTYLRPGVALEPARGMAVTVRCRTPKREQAVAKIEEVGHHYEAITNLALLRPGVPFELGRPVAIGVPASLRSVLKPGELVDLDAQGN